jgi:putative NIF3 family GTP cyclohydrolase 1 type 2
MFVYHTDSFYLIELRRSPYPRTVQVALTTNSPNDEVRSVAICAGSGGSMLLGVNADVYFTGEMSHVRLNTRRSWDSRIKLIYNAPA